MTTRKTNTSKARTRRSAPATTVATSHGTVRFVEPQKSKTRRASKPKVVELVGQTDDVLLDQVGGFVGFLQEYAVVGLAIGFIVGQQANGVVKQLVASFIDPLFVIIFGENLSGRTITVHHNKVPVNIPWGAFVYTLMEFFFVLLTIYALIKLFKLDKFSGKKHDKSAAK